jgi:hypothetical protein
MKIDRSAFIYLPPKEPAGEFAQCETCIHFIAPDRCGIFAPDDAVKADASCGLYLHGDPEDTECRSTVTPDEAGYIAGAVRCENCSWFDDGTCGLYRDLSDRMGDAFALDAEVDAQGCCNAFTPMSTGLADAVWIGEVERLIGPFLSRQDYWDESEHPRGQPKNAGQFVKGGRAGPAVEAAKANKVRAAGGFLVPPEHAERVIGGIPDSPPWTKKSTFPKAFTAIHEAAARAISEGKSAEDIAKALTLIAANYRHGAVASYANNVMRYLERELGLEHNSLGRAVSKQKIEEEAGPKEERPPKGGYTSVEEVLKARQPGSGMTMNIKEQEWHRKAFTNATPELLAAMAKSKALSAVVAERNKTSYYRPSEHLINMQPDHGGGDDWDSLVWRHEFGHALDWNGAGASRNNLSYYICEEARANEANALLYKASKDTKRHSPAEAREIMKEADLSEPELAKFVGVHTFKRRAIFNVLEGNLTRESVLDCYAMGTPDGGMLRDFIGAMTEEKIGGGHGKSYYEQAPENKTAEMFANYVSLTNGENGALYRKLLHKIAPRCCEGFDLIISGLGEGLDRYQIERKAKGL